MKVTPFYLSLLVLLFVGCNEDEGLTSSQALVGTWYRDADGDDPTTSWRSEITYGDDNFYKLRNIVVDKATGIIIGYQNTSYGYYTVEGDSLLVTPTAAYESKAQETPYSGPSYDLVPSPTPSADPTPIHFRVKDLGKTLTFYPPPCDDIIGNCLSTFSYARKETEEW